MQAVNAVCAEGMMRTARYEPTPAWEHALAEPDCPCHLLLVALDGADVVGWCRLFPAGEDREVELGIGVLSGYRRQGVGRALLSAALEWADRRKADVVLQTRSDNLPAVRLFGQKGFRTVHREGGLLTMYHSSDP